MPRLSYRTVQSCTSQLGQAIEGRRQLGDRTYCEAHEEQRVVISRSSIQIEVVTARAPMHDQPFTVASDRSHWPQGIGR